MKPEVEFEVESKLGKLISATKEYWKIIVAIKHPAMKGKEKLAMQTLHSPAIIKRSQKAKDIYLYYRKNKDKLICVVARHENGSGFVITAYLTDRIKQGEIVWTK